MTEGWIKIYTAEEEYQAKLIEELLQNNGLHPVIMDKRDDVLRIPGFVEVYVAPEEAEQANGVIESNKER